MGKANRFNVMLNNYVSECNKAIFDILKKHDVVKVVLADHDVEEVCAVFEDEDLHFAYCTITELVFDKANETLMVNGVDRDGNLWGGYIDKYYGDYFNVPSVVCYIHDTLVKIFGEDE